MSAPETELCAKPREWPNSCAATAKRLVPERKQREAFQSSDLALSLRLFLLSSTIFLVVLSPVSSSKFLSFSFFLLFFCEADQIQAACTREASIFSHPAWRQVAKRQSEDEEDDATFSRQVASLRTFIASRRDTYLHTSECRC